MDKKEITLQEHTDLIRQYQECKASLIELNEILNSREKSHSDVGIVINGDVAADKTRVLEKLAEIEYILINYKIKTEINSERIEVGTVFSAAIVVDGARETSKFILGAIAKPNLDDELSNVSVESNMGKAVYGKKVNDSFLYKIGESIVNGVILDILKTHETDLEIPKTR